MNRDSQAFLSRTGVSNIENIRFEKIHNKYNVLTNQTTEPTINNGTQSVYMVNNELYFNNNKLTLGGSITGGTGTISDSPFTITNGTITQKTPQPINFSNQEISNISTGIFSTLTSTKGTITDFYSTNATLTNLAVETITMSGSTRTINNLSGITFNGTNTFINGLNNLTLSGNLTTTLSTIGTLTCAFGSITNLNSSTITTSTLNLTNLTVNGTMTASITNTSTLTANMATISVLHSLEATITDLFINNGTFTNLYGGIATMTTSTAVTTNNVNAYITNLFVDNMAGRNSSLIEIQDQNQLRSPEIQVQNSEGTARMYAEQYWVGTKGSNPTPLANYIQTRIGTISDKTYSNFFVVPEVFRYLDLELNKGNTDNLSGLTTDVLEVEEIAIIKNVYCEEFYCSSSAGNVFDFFDSVGNLIMSVGQAYADYKLAKKALKIGAGALLAVGALSAAGNIIYGIATEASTPSASDYLDMAHEYGCQDSSGSLSFSILQNPIGAPDNTRTLFTFAYNPGFGRLCSGGYVQTEMAQPLGQGPDAEFAVYSIINGHDKQRSIEFNQYDSVSQWNTGAKQGINGAGVTRAGAQMWDRRLVAIDTGTVSGQFQPRLRFHHEDNQIAYLSDITHTLTDYWEISNGYLQPNANSGLQGKIQINTNNVNIFEDVYLSSGRGINFIQSTKGRISYDDTAKTLTFRNSDNGGEYIFNDYLDNPQFRIDVSNNRIEIPQSDLFFQESGDQDIYKAGSGSLNFKYSGTITAYMENGKGLSVPNALYFDYTGGGTGAPVGGTLSGLYRIGTAPDDFLFFSGNKIADYRYGATGSDLETPNLWVRSGFIYFDDPPNYTTNTPYIKSQGGNIAYHTETGAHIFEIGTTPTINTYMSITSSKTNIYNDLFFDGPAIEFNTSGTPATITNKLFRNGSDLIYETTTLTSTGSSFFTEANGTATSSNLDFKFTQNLEVNGTLSNDSRYVYLGETSGGGHNMVFDLPAGSNNSQITINSGERFINYNANTNKGLYISHQGGSDSEHNIQFQLHASPTTYVTINDTTTTFENDIDVATGHNIDINNGTLTVIGAIDVANDFKVRSSNVATNVIDLSMSDTTASFLLNGGSSPDNFIFRDYDSMNIFQAQRNNFKIFNSGGSTTFWVQSANCSIYNPLDVNDINSRSGSSLDLGYAGTVTMSIANANTINIPTADLYLNAGNTGTINDSNAIHLGQWRIKQAIVPFVEFQALRFQYDPDNVTKGGYILKSRNDAVITFTGQHKNAVIEEEGFILEKGMLLSSTGIIKNYNEENIITISETLPILKPTETVKDKAVFGVWTGEKKKVNEYIQGSFGTSCEPLEEDNSRCLINSTGEGAILVCNEGGDIEIGDYICSSNSKGIGMRQDDDLNHNYTIAKATTAYKFGRYEDNKNVLVGCLYML